MTIPSLPRRRIDPARLVAVSLGLFAGGMALGAIAGSIGVLLWIALGGGNESPTPWIMLRPAALVGGFLGAVLLPVSGLTALRHVPLGRVLTKTTLATASVAAVGGLVHPGLALPGALTGFFWATLTMWGQAREALHREQLTSSTTPTSA
jgi:hypothetical protein